MNWARGSIVKSGGGGGQNPVRTSRAIEQICKVQWIEQCSATSMRADERASEWAPKMTHEHVVRHHSRVGITNFQSAVPRTLPHHPNPVLLNRQCALKQTWWMVWKKRLDNRYRDNGETHYALVVATRNFRDLRSLHWWHHSLMEIIWKGDEANDTNDKSGEKLRQLICQANATD